MNTLNNGYQGQLVYNTQQFDSETDLFPVICSDSLFEDNKCYLRRIGVMAHPGDIITLGNVKTGGEIEELNPITVGKTGMYEVDNVKIKKISIKINENTSDDTAIIDYILIADD